MKFHYEHAAVLFSIHGAYWPGPPFRVYCPCPHTWHQNSW